jgi:two-component system phosphate regulon sensor histidine kinase PhoR
MDATEADRAILAGLPLPCVVIGGDDRIVAANPPAVALFGAAMEGRHFGLTFRQPDLLAAIAAARGGAASQQVRQVQHGASQDSVYEVTVTAVPQGVLLAFQDVSALAQMDQMRRDFVANVSHELRTPLTALLGFIETLRGPARDDAAARTRFLGIMATEAERMNRLVRDLLHLSRVEAEERVVPQGEVDLGSIARTVAGMFSEMAAAAGVRIVITGADAPLVIRADHDQMVQVLSNLIENAVKYGSPAGGQVTVGFQRVQTGLGPKLHLTVADQGEGIDPLHVPRLTERFYRVDGHRSREKGGTGLGLAIVKHIVSRHRGRLQIESEEGKGSVFRVILPISA